MTQWGVIPSIRVRDMAEALAFYRGTLEFELDSGGDAATNSSLTREGAHVMIETAADHYGDAYNAAIRERLGTPSCVALYMEAADLAAATRGWKPRAPGSPIRSPHGPGARTSSRSRITRATG
jgi:catechol 2,3-dioxygenase-like lactoylglutathione lyase family enzyme